MLGDTHSLLAALLWVRLSSRIIVSFLTLLGRRRPPSETQSAQSLALKKCCAFCSELHQRLKGGFLLRSLRFSRTQKYDFEMVGDILLLVVFSRNVFFDPIIILHEETPMENMLTVFSGTNREAFFGRARF